MKKETTTCIIEECIRKAYARGICQRHCTQLHKRKKRGEFTDEQLIEWGMILPSRKGPMDALIDKMLKKIKK